MRYQFTVVFTREMDDDLEIAKVAFPTITDERELLLQQLRAELQLGFDNGMAGEFDINRESFNLLGA